MPEVLEVAEYGNWVAIASTQYLSHLMNPPHYFGKNGGSYIGRALGEEAEG